MSVNGESMHGRRLDDVVQRMRGKPGTSVEVAFGREGRMDAIELSIVREVIRVESVSVMCACFPMAWAMCGSASLRSPGGGVAAGVGRAA